MYIKQVVGYFMIPWSLIFVGFSVSVFYIFLVDLLLMNCSVFLHPLFVYRLLLKGLRATESKFLLNPSVQKLTVLVKLL